MAYFVTPVVASLGTASVDASALNTLGTHAFDTAGNEYVYLTGVVDTLAGTWVTVGASNLTAVAAAGAKGAVAVAMAAIVAGKYGWYQIKGWNTIALGSSNGATTSGGTEMKVDITAAGNAGTVSVATGDSLGATAAEHIFGAFSYSAAAACGGAITVYLNYPFLAPLTAAV